MCDEIYLPEIFVIEDDAVADLDTFRDTVSLVALLYMVLPCTNRVSPQVCVAG